MAEQFMVKYGKERKQWYLVEHGFFHTQTLQSYDTKKAAMNDVEKLAQRDNEMKIVGVYNKKGVQIRTEKFRP